MMMMPGQAAIVEALFSLEGDPETMSQLLDFQVLQLPDGGEGVVHNVVSSHHKLKLVAVTAGELLHLPHEHFVLVLVVPARGGGGGGPYGL